ncbi:MAG TPA: hypothetical protein VK174_13360 [Chitinophagales bacterium]|nr:hypothetical protein [Chitinophagales bacterium]
MCRVITVPFIFFLILTSVTGCKKLDKLTQFNMDYESEIIYSAGLPVNLPVNISTPDMVTNSEEEFALNDTRKNLIESIKLTQLRLNITAPAGKTFSFLKEVRVYVSAPGLPEIEVANKLNIDNASSSELQLTVFDIELQDYIKADKFSLRVASTTDEILTSQVTVHIYSNFFVDAKIFGI